MKNKKNLGLKFLAIVAIIFLTISSGCSEDKQDADKKGDSTDVSGSSGTGNSDEKPLVFGTTPIGKKDEMTKRFSGLIDYLSEKLGRKVIFTISIDYDTLAKDLNNGNIDFAIISPTAYVKAIKDYPKLKYVATTVEKKTKQAFYYGYIFTRKDSGINSYRDLRGKLFAFVDEGSGSGFKFPVAMMINKWKIDPRKYFKKTLFMGNHPNVIDAVYKKQAHAGATWMFPYEEKIKNLGKNSFKILLKTPPIPSDAFTVSPQTSDETVKKLREILLSINDETKTSGGKNVIKDFYYMGFVVKNNSFYDIIRQTAQTIKKWQKK